MYEWRTVPTCDLLSLLRKCNMQGTELLVLAQLVVLDINWGKVIQHFLEFLSTVNLTGKYKPSIHILKLQHITY